MRVTGTHAHCTPDMASIVISGFNGHSPIAPADTICSAHLDLIEIVF